MNIKTKYCLITNDVETTSIVNNQLSLKTGKLVAEEGVPKVIDLFTEYNIKSTFFITGEFAEKFPNSVKLIFENGHEIASHGYSHEPFEAFDVLSYEKQVEHLKLSKNILENITGAEVISFRAPALRVNEFTAKALVETGFKIDSSVSSQRFDMFLSYGSKNKLGWLTAPRLPYLSSINNLNKRGSDGVIEVPISSFLMPYVGTTLRSLPLITRILGRFLILENKINNKPINLLIHPNEYIIEARDKSISLKRSNNLFVSLLADYLRNKIKQKNLGNNGLAILEKEVQVFQKKEFRFTTIASFVKQSSFNI